MDVHNHPPTKDRVDGCQYCEQHGNVFESPVSPRAHELKEGMEVELEIMAGRYVVTRMTDDHLVVHSVLNPRFAFRVLQCEVVAVYNPYKADS